MNLTKLLQGIDDFLYGLAALVVQLPRTFFTVLVHPVRYAVLRRQPPEPDLDPSVAPGVFFGAVLGVIALSSPLLSAVRQSLTSGSSAPDLAAGLHPLFGDESRLSGEMELVSLVLAYGGAILGSSLVAQRWLPRDGGRGLSRPVFSAHCAYWSVCLFFLWLAQVVRLLGDWRSGRATSLVPRVDLPLVVSVAACLWLVCAFYGIMRQQGALSRTRAAGVALLSFATGLIFNVITTALVVPTGFAKLVKTVLRPAS